MGVRKYKSRFDIKNYTKQDFKIRYSQPHGYYISHMKCDSIYMHKNGSLHNFCGEGNFFNKKTEAITLLNKSFQYNLPEELFEI